MFRHIRTTNKNKGVYHHQGNSPISKLGGKKGQDQQGLGEIRN